MSTRAEYLAEGAQSFFDCNADSHPPNGIHNYVNTRSELKCYDSVLSGFLKEIFPCQNKFLERCDARAGVKPYNFKMNCDSEGNGIWMDFQTEQPSQTQPTSTPRVFHQHQVPPLARQVNYSSSFSLPFFFTACIDNHQFCSDWARIGECQRNPGYMSFNCRKSCKQCS
ncbi:unnamed protein product [Porites lobata]|uniref:ShKT domain-containing protein n=1 Tax=Porites lobata TaxID=104759 RepID=A0ABN8NB31_9CNID|nr:unnamed protein product [Porites lobata]